MAHRTYAGPVCNFFCPIYDFHIVIFRFRAIPGVMEPQLWFLKPVRLFFFCEMAGIGHLEEIASSFSSYLPELMEMSHKNKSMK